MVKMAKLYPLLRIHSPRAFVARVMCFSSKRHVLLSCLACRRRVGARRALRFAVPFPFLRAFSPPPAPACAFFVKKREKVPFVLKKVPKKFGGSAVKPYLCIRFRGNAPLSVSV